MLCAVCCAYSPDCEASGVPHALGWDCCVRRHRVGGPCGQSQLPPAGNTAINIKVQLFIEI